MAGGCPLLTHREDEKISKKCRVEFDLLCFVEFSVVVELGSRGEEEKERDEPTTISISSMLTLN